MTDLEWFEEQKGHSPSIGYFPSADVWYAEIVLGNRTLRKIGNGETLLLAIADLRKRVGD